MINELHQKLMGNLLLVMKRFKGQCQHMTDTAAKTNTVQKPAIMAAITVTERAEREGENSSYHCH